MPAIELPTGGTLLGFPDLDTQPEECGAAVNLQTQAAPFLALLSSQVRILKLLKPLIEIVRALPNVPAHALAEFSSAAQELTPLFLALTPAGALPFVRDLICLEIQSLNCFLRNLQAAAGDGDSQVQNVLASYPPIAGILQLAGPFFEMAGLSIPNAPKLSGGTDPVSLAVDEATVIAFVATLQIAADSLGGCQ